MGSVNWDKIRKNSNDFNYVDTLASFVGNRNFRRGYDSLKSGNRTNETYVWETLSAIGDIVGDTVYQNVLNYIDNVSNIDTCGIKALRSIAKMIGVKYAILDQIQTCPQEVLDLIDIFSVNRRFYVDREFVSSQTLSGMDGFFVSTENDDVANQLSGFDGKERPSPGFSYRVDNEKYEKYIQDAFYGLLDSMTKMMYQYPYDKVSVMSQISGELVYENNTGITKYETYDERIRQLKLKHGITGFSNQRIADDIDKGDDFLDNYTGIRRTILDIEFEKRSSVFRDEYKIVNSRSENDTDANKLQTRYSYYREQKVKEYFDFIQSEYSSFIDKQAGLLNDASVYDVDRNYIEISSPTVELLTRDGTYHDEYVVQTSKILKDICIAISEIRERLKTEAQRYHMRGTFTLLSYIINEYLVKNVALRYPELSTLRNFDAENIQVVEYDDTTEYFNIKTQTDGVALSGDTTNQRFWEEVGSGFLGNSGFAFSASEIEKYYLDTLNVGDGKTDLDDFLTVIYDLGASVSFTSKDTGEPQILSSENNEANARTEQLFLKFNGQDVGYQPYANYKNVAHPSYQVHPYLRKFIESSQLAYPIVNAFYNDANENLEDDIAKGLVDRHIGPNGNSVDVWLHNVRDYSGWMSRYEKSSHVLADDVGKVNGCIDYDGMFYPPAVEDFARDKRNFIDDVRSRGEGGFGYFERYYSHLSLTDEELYRIAKQLDQYGDRILEITSERGDDENVFDVFKYGLDAYGNSIMIVKSVQQDETYSQKLETPGELWMRVAHHPFAFPAYSGAYPQVNVEKDNDTNGKVNSLLGKWLLGNYNDQNNDRLIRFYDFEFDSTRRVAVASVQDDVTDSDGNVVRSGYRDSIHLVLVSGQYFDYSPSEMRRKYQLGVDKDSNTTRIDVGSGYLFAGYFCDKQTLGVASTKVLEDGTLHIRTATYHRRKTPIIHSDYVFRPSDIGRKIVDGTDFRVQYTGNHFVFAFLTEPNNKDHGEICNFVGRNSDDSLAEGKMRLYESSVDAEDAETSIDYFNKHVTTVQFDVVGYDIVSRTVDVRHHNLNGDISYIPLYSGEDGRIKTHIVPEYSSADFFSFELLGYDNRELKELVAKKEQNLKSYIQGEIEYLTDVSTEELLGDGAFRVYEDYTENGTRSAKIESSPSFGLLKLHGGNKPYYEWVVSLSDLKQDILGEYQCVLLNRQTSNRNPIFNGTLSNLKESLWYNIEPTKFDKDYYENRAYGGQIIEVGGIQNCFTDETRSYNDESNHIFNISGVDVDVNLPSKTLTFRFYVDTGDHVPDELRGNTIIKKGQLKLYIFHAGMLENFEQYHFLDTFRNCRVTERIMKDGPELAMYPFFRYDDLSEIPILSGRVYDGARPGSSDYTKFDGLSVLTGKFKQKVLSFKADENFPTRDYDFPFEYYEIGPTDKDTELSDKLNIQYSSSGVFSISNTYIVQVTSPEMVKTLTKVKIPLDIALDEETRVYEDYLSVMYSIEEDDREFAQYMKFSDTATVSSDAMSSDDGTGIWLSSLYGSTFSEVQEELSVKYGLFGGATESNDIAVGVGYAEYELSVGQLDEFFNMFVSYDADRTLYFNCNNLFNTPYVFRSKTTGDTCAMYIDSTYLKVESGQTGKLDIILQFKVFNHNKQLIGQRTAVFASYEITNVSDDKPKFVLRKTLEGPGRLDYIDFTGSGVRSHIIAESQELSIDNALDATFHTSRDIEFKVHIEDICGADPREFGAYFMYDHQNGLIELSYGNDGKPKTVGCEITNFGDGYVEFKSNENTEDAYITFIMHPGYKVDSGTERAQVYIDLVKGWTIDEFGNSIQTIIHPGKIEFFFVGNRSMIGHLITENDIDNNIGRPGKSLSRANVSDELKRRNLTIPFEVPEIDYAILTEDSDKEENAVNGTRFTYLVSENTDTFTAIGVETGSRKTRTRPSTTKPENVKKRKTVLKRAGNTKKRKVK